MGKRVKQQLKQALGITWLSKRCQQLELPGLDGLSLYDLLALYILGLAKGAIGTRASAIAFNFFTAIFPFLLFVLIVIPYIPIEGFKQDFEQFLNSFLPPRTSDFFFQNIFATLDNKAPKGLLSSAFLVSLVLMANGVNAVFAGFESSYHEQLSRHFLKQYFYAFSVALILAGFSILSVVFLGYFQIYIIGNLDSIALAYNLHLTAALPLLQYAFFVMMVYVTVATLYYFGTKEGRLSRFFSAGALFTTLLVIAVSFLFGLYINNFSRFNELYGSIGALLILLAYLWLNSNLLILGYELNASINGLRKRL